MASAGTLRCILIETTAIYCLTGQAAHFAENKSSSSLTLMTAHQACCMTAYEMPWKPQDVHTQF